MILCLVAVASFTRWQKNWQAWTDRVTVAGWTSGETDGQPCDETDNKAHGRREAQEYGIRGQGPTDLRTCTGRSHGHRLDFPFGVVSLETLIDACAARRCFCCFPPIIDIRTLPSNSTPLSDSTSRPSRPRLFCTILLQIGVDHKFRHKEQHVTQTIRHFHNLHQS